MIRTLTLHLYHPTFPLWPYLVILLQQLASIRSDSAGWLLCLLYQSTNIN